MSDFQRTRQGQKWLCPFFIEFPNIKKAPCGRGLGEGRFLRELLETALYSEWN